MPTASVTTKRNCYCKQCGKRGFTRSEMKVTVFKDVWLCPACNADPYVRGSDAMVKLNAALYPEASLNVVGLDEGDSAAPALAPVPVVATPDSASKRLRQWRAAVFADPTLTNLHRVLLLAIAEHANWKTGGGIRLKAATVAAELGWSVSQVRYRLEQVGLWLEQEVRHVQGQQASNGYHLRWPNGQYVAGRKSVPEIPTGPV